MTAARTRAGPESGIRRAAALLGREGAWLQACGADYWVRIGQDRRRRPVLRIDEAAFRALVEAPGLKPLGEGAWVADHRAPDETPPPGRPGLIEGERTVMDEQGRLTPRQANLGESPIAWLARRRGPDGRPWLTAAEAAAGERLRDDFQRAGTIGRLTMRWDPSPRSASGGGARVEPVEQARAAKARIERALAAVGPGLREMLERVCLASSALEAAERDLGLPRRAGKTVLKLALARLAAHYGLA